ncbi:MAG: DNA mismatch repair endonuclease MutL [bacterium]
MAKIKQLSEQISNMIAAGEVVEGPLSVVKELVENSIDANSTKIEIYLKESGVSLIEIIDDGYGMDPEDAALSFSRHATSKIETEGDLFRISSLGFRGEALPSIASISHMTMITRSDSHEGYKIKYEFGKRAESMNFPSNKGTKISIEKLFYNTPARLKYLKSENVILSSIVDVITRLSIAYPNISFKLSNNDSVMFQTRGQSNMVNLLANIYGVNVGKSLSTIQRESEGFKLTAYIAKPEFTRSRNSEITIIVNNRYVKSKLIVDSVVEAYRDYIPHLRYPICVINLDVDPLLIDVNVHPTKMEIKFSLEDTISYLVKSSILDSLSEKTLIAEHRVEKETKVGTYDETLIDINNKLNIESDDKTVDDMFKPNYVITEEIQIPAHIKELANEYDASNENVVIPEFKGVKEEVEEKEVEISITPSKEKLPYMEYCGIVFGAYLVFQNNTGMYLIDQHAAQERIKYEHYFKMFANPKKESIDLLLPLPLEFTLSESLLLETNLSKLEEMGLLLEQSGPQTFLVRSIPTWVKGDDPERIVERIVTFLVTKKDFNIGLYRDSMAKMVSCKESIKANNHTTPEEAIHLYEELKTCINPFNCPHGRPSIVRLSVTEIEKMFRRIV